MTSPKAAHYNLQLQSALCRGAWADSAAARAPNGEALSWPELFRKFRKHCPGQEGIEPVISMTLCLGVTNRAPNSTASAVIASELQTLSVLLIGSKTPVGGERSTAALDGDIKADATPLSLGDEMILESEWHDEAKKSSEAIQNHGFSGVHEQVRPRVLHSQCLDSSYFLFAVSQISACSFLLCSWHLR